MNKKIDIDVTAYQIGPVVLMCGAAAPGHDVTHQECFGRFTVLALSLNAAIRKCMRRVARMCADCSAREQLDHQEGARTGAPKASAPKRRRNPCASPSTR